MARESRMHNLMSPNVADYVQMNEDIDEKRDEFMTKYLRRQWPSRLSALLGTVQLIISLIIMAVDIPIILMFAPRWEVFVAGWALVFTLIAAISTLHTVRETTWSKVKWAAGLNILGAIAAALMIAFNVLFLVNPYICLLPTGCKYLGYTYSKSGSFMAGEVVLGIAFLVTVFLFLVFYIKYGIGGKARFEDILDGVVTFENAPMISPTGAQPVRQVPAAGEGVRMAQRTTTALPTTQPRFPPQPGTMMPQLPPGAQWVTTAQGPMIMVPNPQGGPPNFFRPPPPQAQAPYATPMMPNVAGGAQ